jgi:hypothetical protein
MEKTKEKEELEKEEIQKAIKTLSDTISNYKDVSKKILITEQMKLKNLII